MGDSKTTYNRFLLLVAGLGGLLYGVDVGIIGGALPYLEATSHLNAGQLSIIVAAVLLGSVISTLFAGLLADWMGRKPLMMLSGLLFVCSIPVIALSHGYSPLFFGRLLQGISGGLDWDCGSAVPCGMSQGSNSRKRDRRFPVAAYARPGSGGTDRNLLQLSRHGGGTRCQHCRDIRIQEPGLETDFLGIPAAGILVCGRQFFSGRVAAVAI